ncbi:MAG TPA: efflux RND transporter periplasmic adaptor subunit [Thermoanaerobaculia bacterium]|nr:efflux RND transporter periplasmic adaptor subunit [Thermoanaerobaculia bacterium]
MAKGRKSLVRGVVIFAVVLAVASALAIWLYGRRKPRPVVLSGTIEAHTTNVGSRVGGRVEELFVREGAQVDAGQPIARLETEAIDWQIAEQQAAIDLSRAQLEKARAGPRDEEIRRAQAVWENAERERRRLSSLLREGVIPRSAYDDAAMQARTASEELRILNEGTRPEDIDAARAQVERDSRRLGTLREQRAEARVVSPVKGIVQAIGVRPGDLVAPNAPVAEIVETQELWVRVFVPETQLGLVRLGAPTEVMVDSFPDRRYRGRITQISPRGEYTPRNLQTRIQRADQVFGMKVTLEPHADLKPGMAAEVDLGVKGRS